MNSPTEQSDDRRFMELLNRLIPVEAIVETLASLMNATSVMKNGVVVPDWSIRFEAVKLVLAYKIGLPIPRKEIVVVEKSGDKEHDLIERMANSPSLLASVKWMVAQAEARKLGITAEAANRDGTYARQISAARCRAYSEGSNGGSNIG